MKINKIYAKQTINTSIALAVATVLGIEILKRSNNADLKLNGQELPDEVVGKHINQDLFNELSKGI